MTTYITKTVKCGVCGAVSKQTVISSTNAFGSSDLDTRPPQMERATIDTWVKRCLECGACAADLAKLDKSSKSIIESAKYREQLDASDYPELANHFICKSIIQVGLGQLVEGTWSLIHSAWILDDYSYVELAISVRKKVASMLLKLESSGEIIAVNKESNTALLIDLLRRAKDFHRASKIIKERESVITEEIIITIVNFQKMLISKQNFGCFRISDAVEFADGTWKDLEDPTREKVSKWWQFRKS